MICKLSLESVPIDAVNIDYSSSKKVIPWLLDSAIFEYKFNMARKNYIICKVNERFVFEFT
jgi:hypothetical protein